MNTPEKNNYIQYVNKNGIVKAKNVVFENDGTTTRFTVSGIDEEFFIFAIYENNIQRFCVGIENLENTDMLGFINANVVDLSCIPEYSFLPPQTDVEFSYNNEYVRNNKFGESPESVGSSDLPLATDTDDLKYIKSLMKTLYPANTFTYIPYFISYDNQLPNRWEQPNAYPVNSSTCFWMYINCENDVYLENKLSTHRNLAGDYVELNTTYGRDLPYLFTGFQTGEGNPPIWGHGYKIVSNNPLWIE